MNVYLSSSPKGAVSGVNGVEKQCSVGVTLFASLQLDSADLICRNRTPPINLGLTVT
jgi:hypothetical protein